MGMPALALRGRNFAVRFGGAHSPTSNKPDRLDGIAFYGSMALGPDTADYARVRELGEALARPDARGKRRHWVNGGGPGLMQALAEGAKAAGGHTVGAGMVLEGQARNTHLFDEFTVHPDLHARAYAPGGYQHRAAMTVAAKGGLGTLKEIVDTLIDIGVNLSPYALQKQVVLYDPDGYYEKGLLPFLGFMVAQGTVKPQFLDLLKVARTPQAVNDALAAAVGHTSPRPRTLPTRA